MLVHPAALLDDCERVWRESGAFPAGDALTAEPERMALVLEALVAYEIVTRAKGQPGDAVYLRWPACTVRSVVYAARSDTLMLAMHLWKARERVLAALPDLAASDAATTYLTIVAQWWEGADIAARALGWPWLLPAVAARPTLEPAAPVPTRPKVPCVPSPPPELRLGIGGSSVLLHLGTGATDETWRISADGETAAVQPPHWVLHRPVRRIEATDPCGAVHTVPVVDPDTALLAFTADGQRLDPGEPLPANEVYLLHVGALDTDGPSVGVVELPTPYGWTGWTLSRLSLAGVRRIRTDKGISGRWFEVAVGGPMRWEGGERLQWITHTDGTPVWRGVPALRLPHRLGESTSARWQVEVVRTGTSEVLARTAGSPGALVDPWRDVPRPLLGPYQVIARRGSAGTGQRLSAFLADGVRTEASAEWRLLAPSGGLAPAVITAEGTDAISVSRNRMALAPYEIEKSFSLRANARSFTVLAQIPYSELRLEADGRVRQWSIRPVDIEASELTHDCVLTVRLPEAAVAVTPMLVLVVDGTALHNVRPERRVRTRKGDLRYSLTALADTVRDCPKAELRLEVAGERVLVGTIRTQPLADRIEADEVGLRLSGLRHSGELTASVFAALAPWARPLTVAVAPDGAIPLPTSWRAAGPMIVQLRSTGSPSGDDQLEAWPDQRDRGTLTLRRQSGVPEFTTGLERDVATYLAGRGTLPAIPQVLPYQWLIAARGRDLQSCGVRELVPAECMRALGATPVPSLLHAAEADLRSGDLARVIVGSGLAAHRIRGVDDPEAVRRVWRTAPVSALLLTAPLLPYLSGSALYSPEELYPEELALLGEVETFLGVTARTLLSGGADPFRSIGRFGAEARALDSMPEVRQREVQRRVGLVPHAMLDGDTRAAAVWQAFRDRRTLQHFAADPKTTALMKVLETFLRNGHDALADALDQRAPGPLRGPEESWMLVPRFSLGFALVARLAAWGDQQARSMELHQRPVWSSIAFHAPDLAAVDVALAECLVAAEHLRNLS